MFEVLVAATATTGLFAIAKGIRGNETFRSNRNLAISSRDQNGDDLPCPWCYAPTEETDARCSGCGRTFG